MLKSADALAAAGHDVRVVATRHEPWAVDADVDVRSRRSWPLTVVDYRRGAGAIYWRSGIRYRAARVLSAAIGPERMPFALVARAFGRVHPELVKAASAEPADLIYGGTTGGLAAVAVAARRCGARYALDLEDFHSEESEASDHALSHGLARRIEDRILGQAAFLTASSEGIAQAYNESYGVAPSVIHNTFDLPPNAPDFSRARPNLLRLYWFSQTIGAGRGLEDAITAMGLAGVAGELTVRGRPLPEYLDRLNHLARERAPRLRVVHEPPAPPDTMVDLSRGHDVGLALEHVHVRNRQIAQSNKLFTYLLAGNAIAMTDTPGQHALGVDVGAAAGLVPPGDVAALAALFSRWASDPDALDAARRAAWEAARRRWHWQHEDERGLLCRLVGEAAR
jgi:glycosyltransferase involved in cell wall biosynthesis